MLVLVLNCASSTRARFAVVDVASGLERFSALAQNLGSAKGSLEWKAGGAAHLASLAGATLGGAVRRVASLLGEAGLWDGLAGIAHRVVHGGARFSDSIRLTEEVVARIRECIPLGPLHNPSNLVGIEVAQELLPGLPHVAVFDTAFHQTMPPQAYLYAVPYEWFEKHEVRRYGFHGASHRYVSQAAVRRLGLDPADHAIVTAHLGYGCSLSAVRNGRSTDTTMGLTPVDGVVMGTRSGSIDPSIITHMRKALGKDVHEVMDILNRESGLLGISGLSDDMQVLQTAAERGHHRASLAIEKFCHSVAKMAAGMVVSLGRCDVLVFTGGIGEKNARVRGKIVELLGFLGLRLDGEANALHGKPPDGRVTSSLRPQAIVIPTNEELVIALDAARVIGASASPGENSPA